MALSSSSTQSQVGRRRSLATTTVNPTATSSSTASLVEPLKEGSQANLRPLAYWLLGTGALVGGMVTVGGITRLTRSGLSMTDWKLQVGRQVLTQSFLTSTRKIAVTHSLHQQGSLPPFTQEDWEKEFTRYKQYPEYQQRQSMTLEDFKFIFWWEYGHRMMGRFLGFAYGLPLLYFAATKRIPSTLYPRLATLFALGGGQVSGSTRLCH